MDLRQAREALEGKQADALEALSRVDVGALVKALEQDAKRGTMEPGQRKTAHLLLSYYAPKADAKQAHTDAEGSMSKAQILAMLSMLRQASGQASAGQAGENSSRNDRPVIEHEKSNRIKELPHSAKQPPSLGKTDSSAGVPERDEVLSDTPSESSNSASNQGSSFDELMAGRPLL